MKRVVVAGSVAALALIGLGGPASAAPNEAACFGQVHKTINTEGALGFTNVGDVVKALGGKGKNAAAKAQCEGAE